MSDLIGGLVSRLHGSGRKVGFVECDDERVLRAARRLADDAVCEPVLVANPSEVVSRADGLGISLEGIGVLNAGDEDRRGQFAEQYADAVEGMSAKRAARKMRDPLQYAAMLVRLGHLDCLAAGVVHSTGDVIVAAQQYIGMAEGIKTVSSLGFAHMRLAASGKERWVCITDCAVNESPTAEQLSDIVVSSAASYRGVFGRDPRVALLSFSTCGSAEGSSPQKMRDAVGLVRGREPGLDVDGEFQLEVALVPELAARKLKGRESAVAGRADIVVFPNLDAGNIAVKCMGLFGGFETPGPILQGFSHPVTDFSRSATEREVYDNVVLALSMAGGRDE